MHVTIATPMYGGQCTGAFTKSLVETMSRLVDSGINVSFIDVYNESLITRARNTLTHMFLASNSDYLLFIDADQSFRSQDVLAMISADLDILGAPVPMKGINWDRIKQAAIAGRDNLQDFSGLYNVNFLPNQFEGASEINLADPIEVLYIGTGMMLIKRKVFEKLKDSVGSYVYDGAPISINNIVPGVTKIEDFWNTSIVDGRLLSEDYNFCDMWKKSGGKVYAYLLAKVTHLGNYEFSGSIFDPSQLRQK
jgi:hypothetical protein